MFNWSKWSLGGKTEGTKKGFIFCTHCTDKWGIAVQTAAVCFQPEPEPYHAWGSEQLIYGKQCLGAPAGPGDQQGQISPCLVLEQSYTHTVCVCDAPECVQQLHSAQFMRPSCVQAVQTVQLHCLYSEHTEWTVALCTMCIVSGLHSVHPLPPDPSLTLSWQGLHTPKLV